MITYLPNQFPSLPFHCSTLHCLKRPIAHNRCKGASITLCNGLTNLIDPSYSIPFGCADRRMPRSLSFSRSLNFSQLHSHSSLGVEWSLSINIRYIAAVPMWLELGVSPGLIAGNVTLPRLLTDGGGWLLARTSLVVILLDGFFSVPATKFSPAIPCVLLLACIPASRISSIIILLHSSRKSHAHGPACGEKASFVCKGHV
ncbi:uncharacterized protein BO96DRAFT_243029 [Aspergillus niger CBS 101883]|uniref:uncharacterized protein n=1 Tax=Aspergillus lacticoffeatus (strain CBS 101883) TaxID=1450533 RepID=UPI000D7FB49C|nr:uncharacterized protein BO96DRAFT_243029 [Aspergillus niger CBS 101883]PYH58482.1 hypothetical protein BO96DRAFT_243029 [Aspergillus niger CBS 101883]